MAMMTSQIVPEWKWMKYMRAPVKPTKYMDPDPPFLYMYLLLMLALLSDFSDMVSFSLFVSTDNVSLGELNSNDMHHTVPGTIGE